MLNLLVGCLNLGLVMGHNNGAGNCVNTVPSADMPGYGTSNTAWTMTGPTAGINAGDTITLTLGAAGAVRYKGISLYCENTATNAKIGSFTMPGSNFQANTNCGSGNEGLTHSSNTAKSDNMFNWTAPLTTTQINVVCKGIAFNGQDQWQPNMVTASFAVAAGTAAPTTPGTTLAPTNSVAPTAAAPSSAEAVGVSMAACALVLAMMA